MLASAPCTQHTAGLTEFLNRHIERFSQRSQLGFSLTRILTICVNVIVNGVWAPYERGSERQGQPSGGTNDNSKTCPQVTTRTVGQILSYPRARVPNALWVPSIPAKAVSALSRLGA